MASKIVLKKSSVVGKVPTTADLDYGEVALNYADGRLYYKTSSNTIEYFSTTADSLGTITSGTWNADVIQIAYGGTGASTRAAALNNLLPNQAAAGGLYLTTDGVNASWANIEGGVGSINDSSVYRDTFTGNGSTTTFELALAPPDENATFVSINGVLQDPATYNVAGTSVEFSTAPATGDNIDVRTIAVVSTKLTLRDFKKFVYSITTTTSTVSGADNNGVVLEYDPGKLDVFQNGVKLVEGTDYTAVNLSSITFTVPLANGDTVEVLTYSAAYFVSNPTIVNTAPLTTTTPGQTIDSFALTSYRTAKYLIQAIKTGHVHATEVMVTHNGTNVFISEYGTMYSSANPLITVSAAIVGGNLAVTVTPASANTTIDFARTALVARTI